jgi:3',5'-cyclic-nucleotide phosphodiesterase
MKKLISWLSVAIVLSFAHPLFSQFSCIPLGTAGGLTEDNLSSYLIAWEGASGVVCIDAGTLYSGIGKAYRSGSFKEIPIPKDELLGPEVWLLRNYIKGYAISHAHLDHVAGLIIASVEDTPKPIYGSASTLGIFKDHLFNWETWPNFGNQGVGFTLNKYEYQELNHGEPVGIPGTGLQITAFPLSHSEPYESTAFLLDSGKEYLLYVGDTGPDEVEKSKHLDSLWTQVAPLVRERKLKALFMEVSYPDGVPDSQLYGHMTPRWHYIELMKLAKKVDPVDYASALKGLTIVVTGIKPLVKKGEEAEEIILRALNEMNELGVRFIIPEQGKKLEF